MPVGPPVEGFSVGSELSEVEVEVEVGLAEEEVIVVVFSSFSSFSSLSSFPLLTGDGVAREPNASVDVHGWPSSST